MMDESWEEIENKRIMRELEEGESNRKNRIEAYLKELRKTEEAVRAMLAEEDESTKRMEKVAGLKKCWMQKCMSMIKFRERMSIEDNSKFLQVINII